MVLRGFRARVTVWLVLILCKAEKAKRTVKIGKGVYEGRKFWSKW